MHETQASNQELLENPEPRKFKARVNDQCDEIVLCNDAVDHIEADESLDGMWHFKAITDHDRPLSEHHENWKGSKCGMLVHWGWNPKHGNHFADHRSMSSV